MAALRHDPAVAVVGATGAVGDELLTLLAQRGFPARSLRAFASPRSAGKGNDVSSDIPAAIWPSPRHMKRSQVPVSSIAGADPPHSQGAGLN